MALYSADSEETKNTLYNQYLAGDVPVLDPYTRSLAEAGISNGQTYELLTSEGYAAELARRQETLKESVVPQAEAQMGVALEDVRKQMASAGKLSSSATTSAMMRTGETYAANVASTLAEGTLGLYSALDASRENELNRIYGSGIARTEAETNLYTSAMGVESQQQIAALQAETQTKIAQIEADTTLTGYEKQVQIAQINAATDLSVAQIQQQTALTIQEKELEYKYDVLDWEKSSFELLNVDPTTGMPAWYSQLQLDTLEVTEGFALAREQMAQAADQFDITQANSMAQFEENLAFMREQFATEAEWQAWEQQYTQQVFEQGVKEFDLTQAQDRAQFEATLAFSKEQFAASEEQRAWEQDYTERVFAAQTTQWELTRQDGLDQYAASLELARDQFASEDAYREWEMKYNETVFAEQVKQQDWSNAENIRQFNESLTWAQEQALMEDTRVRELQSDVLTEQARQFNVTSANDMLQWSQTFAESCRQFNVSSKDQYSIAMQTLEIQKEQLGLDADAQYLQASLQILNDTAVVEFLSGLDDPDTTDVDEGQEVVDAFMTDMFTTIGNMEPGDLEGGAPSTLSYLMDKYKSGSASGSMESVDVSNLDLENTATVTRQQYVNLTTAQKNVWEQYNAQLGKTILTRGDDGSYYYVAPENFSG